MDQSPSPRPLLLTLVGVFGLGVLALGVWQWVVWGSDDEISADDRSAEIFGGGGEKADKTSGPMQGEAFANGNLDAVSTKPDRYWQLESYGKAYPSLKPFRNPRGYDESTLPMGRWPAFWDEVRKLHAIRNDVPADKVSFDKMGREIVDTPAWREALERVRITNLTLAGHVGMVFRDSTSLPLRRDGYYSIFYFDEVQDVLDLAAQICAEPDRRTRQEGFARTLRFLAVHLPESVQVRPDLEGSPVKPKYRFNIWGYLQLVRLENDPRSQAEGLRFLTEVLRIRHDLGRAYLIEIRDMIPKLLASRSSSVREETVQLLSGIDRKKHNPPTGNAQIGDLLDWYDRIAYDLLPPIEHVSTGRTNLHPSKDLDDIVKVGQQALSQNAIGTIKLIALQTGSLRKGLEISSLPKPLHLLGIPKGSVLTNINATPIDSAKTLLDCIRKEVERHQEEVAANKKDDKAKVRPLVFQVWYVHKGRELAKDFHVVQ